MVSKSFLVVSLTWDARKPKRRTELLLRCCDSHFRSAQKFHGIWNWELTEFKYDFHFCKKGFFSGSAFCVRLFSLKSSHSDLLINSSVIFLGFSANLKESGADWVAKKWIAGNSFSLKKIWFHFHLNLNAVLSLTWNGSVEHLSEILRRWEFWEKNSKRNSNN